MIFKQPVLVILYGTFLIHPFSLHKICPKFEDILLRAKFIYLDQVGFQERLFNLGITTNTTQCGNFPINHRPMKKELEILYQTSQVINIIVEILRKMGFDASMCGYNINPICEVQQIDCRKFDNTYQLNGTCNNLKNIYSGAGFTPYAYMIPKTRQHIIRGHYNSRSLSVALNSVKVSGNRLYNEDGIPNLLAVFGLQVFAHEIGSLTTFKPPAGGPNPKCCDLENNDLSHPYCFPIQILPNESISGNEDMTCLEFLHAQKVHDLCKLENTRMLNTQTSPLDASILYGTSKKDLTASIDPTTGKFNRKQEKRVFGDSRSRQTAALYLVQNLFGELHDRLIDSISNFQYARQVVIAVYQKVLIDLAASILGPKITRTFKILDPGDCYDPNLKLVTYAEFSDSVGRYFHSYIKDDIPFHYSESIVVKNLRELFGISSIPTDRDEYALLRGLAYNEKRNDGNVSYVMQNKFVDGCDLFAKDFQREKDAEVANYVEYLDEIMNIRINSFTDFLRFNLISKHNIRILKSFFHDVRDIPALFGVYLETISEDDTILPPTLATIFLEQLSSLKCGDRFFWTRTPGFFDVDQKVLISKITIHELICCYSNGRIHSLPTNAWMTKAPKNPVVECHCSNVEALIKSMVK